MFQLCFFWRLQSLNDISPFWSPLLDFWWFLSSVSKPGTGRVKYFLAFLARVESAGWKPRMECFLNVFQLHSCLCINNHWPLLRGLKHKAIDYLSGVILPVGNIQFLSHWKSTKSEITANWSNQDYFDNIKVAFMMRLKKSWFEVLLKRLFAHYRSFVFS